jgi:hypothetical protein
MFVCLSVCLSASLSLCLYVCLSVYIPTYLPTYLPICLWLYSPLLGLGRFFSFLIIYTVGRTPWTGDQPLARPLSAHRTTQTQNKRKQTSMPQVGFEPTIQVHDLDLAATVSVSVGL